VQHGRLTEPDALALSGHAAAAGMSFVSQLVTPVA